VHKRHLLGLSVAHACYGPHRMLDWSRAEFFTPAVLADLAFRARYGG
jgi:hypothetical protein